MKRSHRTSRRIALLLRATAALGLAFTPVASAQIIDAGGSATGTGAFIDVGGVPATITLAVTGTPQAATGPVSSVGLFIGTFTGAARCIAIDETPTGFRASIAGEITGGSLFAPPPSARGFRLTVYDNTPSALPDQVSQPGFFAVPQTTCTFDLAPCCTLTAGDYVVTPAPACPPNNDEDNDGLTNHNENLFSTLLGNADSDFDGIADGNDDANGNGEDDEDEDDDEDDGCPDEDSDDDGVDDEDEDD